MRSFRTWKVAMTRRAVAGSRTLQTRAGPVQYTDEGEGAPILHVHGSPAGCDIGPLMLAGLVARGFRVLTPSRPGFLGTPLEVGETPEAQADALASFLDALGLDKVSVHAWSAGGPPALQFALRHPSRVSSLVMFAAVAHRWTHRITPFERLVLSDAGLWLLAGLRSLTPETFRRRSAKELGVNYDYAARHPDKLERLDVFFTLSAPASLRLRGSLNDVRQYRSLPDYPLEAIRCPTLVVFSASDAQLPTSHAEVVAARVPDAELVWCKGGHMPQADEDADEVDDLVTRFILEHADRAERSASEPPE